MRRIQFCLIIATAAIVALFPAVRADEQKIPIDELPKAVVDAVKKRFPKAELVGAAKETEGGKTEYEVMLKAGGKKIDVMLTPAGAITVIEKEIAAADLPKEVKATLEKDYPGATCKRIEELIKVTKGKEKLEAYEVLLETADKKTKEVKVPPPKSKKTGARNGDGWTTHFAVDKDELVSTGRNPYFILDPGYVLVLEGGDGRLTITVLNETKTVDGVECRVVQENEEKDGKVFEKSRNYFAISKRTNSVFYFGEDVGGAWLSGEKGARFGLMMPGLPLLGARYYQEVAPGIALDRAQIVGLRETVKTPAGEFKNCLKIQETTPLEPNEKEYKYYAPGIGLVQEGSLKLVRHGNVE